MIDEISFLDVDTLKKIDKNLRILTGRRDKIFGGINVIFSGDLWQLQPVKSANKGYPHWNGIKSILLFF